MSQYTAGMLFRRVRFRKGRPLQAGSRRRNRAGTSLAAVAGTRGDTGGSAERGDIPISSCTLRSPPPKGRNRVERNRQRAGEDRERSDAEPPREPWSLRRGDEKF